MNIFRWYSRMSKKYPWKTQLITTGIIMGSGDLISQTVIERKHYKDIEAKRIVRFFLLGTFFVGPCIRTWYLKLYRIFPKQKASDALKQMCLDQCCFAPLFIASFLTVNGFTQHKSPQEIQEVLQKDYLAILLTNYKLWPAAQLINFYVIPIHHRLLFANCVALIWNSYLSWKANQS